MVAGGDYVTRDEVKVIVHEAMEKDHNMIVTLVAQTSLMKWAGPIIVAIAAIVIGALR